MKKTDTMPAQTRLLPEFYEQIKSHANIHRRSISAEIEQMLYEAMELRLKTTYQFAKPKRKSK